MSEPTLIEDLLEAAGDLDIQYPAGAARLRAAASRLREEMELAGRRIGETARENNVASHSAWQLVYKALRSVNGAPHSRCPYVEPAHPPATCGTPAAGCFVVGEHPTCPACESLVLPTGKCVNGCAPPVTEKRCRHGVPDDRCVDCRAAKLSDSAVTEKRCETWCDSDVTPSAGPRLGTSIFWRGTRPNSVYCTEACRDAGRPLHTTPPTPAKDGP